MSTVKKLREIAKVSAGQGAPQGKDNYCKNGTPFIKAGNLIELLNGRQECDVQNVSEAVAKRHKLRLYPAGTVLFAKSGMSCTKGYVYVLKTDCYVVNHLACIIPVKTSGNYLKYYFEYHKPNLLIKDEAYPSISLSDIGNLDITIESHEREKYIVDCLDKVSMLIENQRRQMQKIDELVRSQFIEMFKDAPNGKLDDVATITMGQSPSGGSYNTEGAGMIFYQGKTEFGDLYINDATTWTTEPLRIAEANDVLMSVRAPVGNTNIATKKCCIGRGLASIRPIAGKSTTMFILYALRNIEDDISNMGVGSTFNAITKDVVHNLPIPLASMQSQNRFVEITEQSDKSKFIMGKRLEALNKCYNALLQDFFD